MNSESSPPTPLLSEMRRSRLTIEIFPTENCAAVTLYGEDGWELRAEATDYREKDIRQSLVILGVARDQAADIAAETVAG